GDAEDQIICSICFCEPDLKATIPCNHAFCFSCIHKWSQTENSCPLCKKRFRFITKHEVEEVGSPSTSSKPQEKLEKVSVANRDQAQ
ncbi:unnamed protein product, partial [Heterosigma akashiwo]